MQDITPNVAHPLAESPPWSCLYSAKQNQGWDEYNMKIGPNIKQKLLAQIEGNTISSWRFTAQLLALQAQQILFSCINFSYCPLIEKMDPEKLRKAYGIIWGPHSHLMDFKDILQLDIDKKIL